MQAGKLPLEFLSQLLSKINVTDPRVVLGLCAFIGVLGGLSTMYAAFASRVRELGTLQVLGYPRSAIVLSLVQESALPVIPRAH